MSTTAENIYALIRLHEGERLSGYQINGIWHIGQGYNVQSGPPISPATSSAITHDVVAWLVTRLGHAVVGWQRLSDVRQSVLIDLAYNVGFSGALYFTKMLQAVALSDWPTAARELRDSDAARELPARYDRLATMMETDQWPA